MTTVLTILQWFCTVMVGFGFIASAGLSAMCIGALVLRLDPSDYERRVTWRMLATAVAWSACFGFWAYFLARFPLDAGL